MERIKRLECPTGEVESRVAGILEEYHVVGKGQAAVQRDADFDRDGAEGYRTRLQGDNKQSLVVLAQSGDEDYVARVIDVYLH
jgi:hypothetical protein